jgi:hypothetical protein
MKKLLGVLILTLALAGLSFGAAGTAGPVPGANFSTFSATFAQPSVSWAATGLTLTYSSGYMLVNTGTSRTAITAGTLSATNSTTNYVYWSSGASLAVTTNLATAQVGAWLYACVASGGNITGCVAVSQMSPVFSTTPDIGAATGTSLVLSPGTTATGLTVTGNVASAASIGVYVNDQTRTTDADGTGVYGIVDQTATALTHELIGIRGRANNHVASMTGSIVGGYFQAANYAAGTTGSRLRGIYVETMAKGVNIATQRAIEGNADGTGGITIATELSAGRFQTATESTSTYSGINTVLVLQNSEQGVGGKSLDSMIYMNSESGTHGSKYLINAYGLKLDTQTGNAVCLMKFKDSNGTARYLIYDSDSATAVSVNTSCP